MKSSYSLLPLILVCLVLACSKEKEDPLRSSYPDLRSFLASIAPQPEIHTGDAGQTITFTTKDGTEFTFQPNSLVDKFGNPVTGMVEIKVTEYNTPEAMITGNIETELDTGGILESGGTFNIEVTQDGQELELKPGQTFSTEFPNNQPDMAGYIGRKNTEGTVQWVKRDDWQIDRTGGVTQTLFPNSLSYCNLDRLIINGNFTQLVLELKNSLQYQQLVASIVLRNRRAVITMGTYDLSHVSQYLPLGEEVTLVVYGYRDGYLYLYDQTWTIGFNETIKLSFIERISETDFEKKIKELNN